MSLLTQAPSTRIRFRKPPFSVSWKRIKVFTSTLAFSQRFPPSTLDHRKRIKTSVFVTSLCSTVLSLHYACLDWNSYSRRDMQLSSDVSVFENLRFHPSTLIRWTSVFKNLHSWERFRKPLFSQTYTFVFDRISVDGRRKRIKMYAFSYENALVWTGPQYQKIFPSLSNIRVAKHNLISN